MEVSSDMLRSTDAPPSSRMMKEINLDPLGINKYDRIFEKFNRLVSTTKEDTNDLALFKYDSECLRAVYDMKTSDRSENVVVSDDNVEVQIIQCPRPTSAYSDPMSFVPEKDAAVDAKLKRVGPKNDLLAATKPKYFVGTQNNSNVDTDKKSTRRVQEDPPEECTTCTLSPSMKYIDTMRDYVSSSRLNSTSVASRDDYGSSKPIYEIHFRDDDIMLFDDSRSRVNSRLEMLNAKSRAFKARLERGDFDGHSLPSTVHESEVRNLNCDWQSSGSDKNGFKTQIDSIKNSTAEVKEKSYVHDTQSTNVMDRKSVSFSEIGVYRDGSGADKSVLLNSERPDTKMSGVKHRSLRSNLLSYQAADLERPSQRAKELVEIKEQFQPSALKSPKLNKEIATRVISEKILQGHMMTRSDCARCGMSLLLTQESAVVCVCCPLMRLRSNIRGGVAKRELAKLVADGYTVCHGNLCTSCHSPKVIKSGDEVCLICPVLDNAIIGFVRAESKGFVLAESSCGCGAKKMKNRSGIESCMICSPASKIADDCIGVMGKEDEMEANEDTAVIDAVPFSASIKSICSMDTAMITNSKIIENSESVIDLNGNAVPAPTDDADKEDEINDDLGLVQDAGREPVFNVKVETGTEAIRAVPPRQVATNRIDPTHLVEQRLSVAPVEGDNKPGDDDPVEKESKLLGAIGRDTLATEQYAKSVHCPSNIATGVSTLAALQEQLKAEIEKAKHWQAALDSTIEKTPEAEMTIPDIGLSTEENAIGSPDSIHSYSISQQEVERGVMKEYIPPKRYFFHKGIPSEVIVDNLQADSVAQSYHTNHLKNTQKISSTTSNISDCFGISSPPKKVTFDVKEYEGFDDETIQTDEDTVDFTWNTWDDSMVDTVNVDDESKKNVAKVVQEEASESNGLCCFVKWLRCGYFDDKSSPVDQEKDNIVVLRGNLGHGNQPPEQTETVHRVPSIYGDSHSLASISREKGMHFDPPNELRGSVFDHQHLVRDDSGVYTDTESLSASKSSIGNIVRIDRPKCAPVNPGCAQNAKSTAEGDCYAVPSSNSAKHYVEVQHIDRVEKHSDLAATQLESPKSQSIKVMGSTDKKEKESSAFYNDAMHLISQNQLRDTEKSSVAGYGEVFEPHQQTEEDWDSNSVNIESVWNDSISLNDYSEPHSFRLSATVAAGDGAAYGTPTSGECRQKVSSASYGCHGGIASTVEYDRYEMRDKYSVPPSE